MEIYVDSVFLAFRGKSVKVADNTRKG